MTDFRRVFLVVVVGASLVVSAACRRSGEAVSEGAGLRWEATFQGALALAEKENRVVMVSFYTDWCGWCRQLERTTLADAQVRKALEPLVLVRLDAEREGRREATRLRVRAYPTIVFLDAGGREVGRIPGYVDASAFLQELEDVLKKV